MFHENYKFVGTPHLPIHPTGGGVLKGIPGNLERKGISTEIVMK